jgi:hypothetical protein
MLTQNRKENYHPAKLYHLCYHPADDNTKCEKKGKKDITQPDDNIYVNI